MVSTRRGETRVGKEEEAPVSVEENKALVRRFLEARTKADLDAMEEMMAPDFVSRPRLPGQPADRESYKRQVAEYVAAFSGVHLIVDEQVADEDRVVSRISGHATHDRRELLGVAPTGSEAAYMAILIHHIAGGKIVEEWGAGTALSELMQQRLEQEKHERERIEQELEVAQRIQQASLPKEVPELEGWQISPTTSPPER